MKKIWLFCGITAIFLAGIGLAAWPAPAGKQGNSQPRVISGLVQTTSAGFARARPGYLFSFPADHGAHPDFQTEWWYYTGNLATTEGHHFGFQLTFFRRALLPGAERTPRSSIWAVEQVYLAHLALSDIDGGKFYPFERLARGAAGLAGAQGEPLYQVWLGNWSVTQTGADSYRLMAEEGEIRLELELLDRKGPVLQGVQGYSQKGAQEGNASHYYSQTRLLTEGTVVVANRAFEVSGTSWMDHEFSTSALAPDQVGWDWFALQLEDGRELMVYTLRKLDGSLDPFSSGTVIDQTGKARRLDASDFEITVTDTWRSPHSGAAYPAGWLIKVPSEKLDLKVQPRLADQELQLSFTYWEGAVEVSGQGVRGLGYVELTGYAQSMQGQF